MPRPRLSPEQKHENARVSARRYYESHREELVTRSKEWSAANRERKHATWKAWYEANRTQIRERAKKPKPPKCSVPECCNMPRLPRSKFCEQHFRDHRSALVRARRKRNPEIVANERRYKAANRQKRNKQRQQKRAQDETVRNRDVYVKRAIRFSAGIQKWCTDAYLSSAKREEYRYAVALRRWIRQCKTERRLLEGFDPVEAKRAAAREKSKRSYWEDPEAARLKSQTFKHSRPDYREEWNAKRGRLEQELSDRTLTREAVERLFAGSSKCPYCGDCYEKSRRSLDHIVPLSKAAGRKLHSINNVLVCCFVCNNKKRTKGLNQFLEELKASAKKNVSQPRTACRSVGLFAAHD